MKKSSAATAKRAMRALQAASQQMQLSAPAKEEAVLGPAGNLHDALGGQVLDLGRRGLVSEGAAAQLPGTVAPPAVYAALCHR